MIEKNTGNARTCNRSIAKNLMLEISQRLSRSFCHLIFFYIIWIFSFIPHLLYIYIYIPQLPLIQLHCYIYLFSVFASLFRWGLLCWINIFLGLDVFSGERDFGTPESNFKCSFWSQCSFWAQEGTFLSIYVPRVLPTWGKKKMILGGGSIVLLLHQSTRQIPLRRCTFLPFRSFLFFSCFLASFKFKRRFFWLIFLPFYIEFSSIWKFLASVETEFSFWKIISVPVWPRKMQYVCWESGRILRYQRGQNI